MRVVFFSSAVTALLVARQKTTNPDPASYYTLSTLSTGTAQCLFPIPGVDGAVPYPVRFSPCDSLEDDKLWQFVPDGAGRYFVYNKAWAGTSQRLDIHCQAPTLCILWMGPSGEKFNNQRWSLQSDPSTQSVKISSLGLPGFFLNSGNVDGSTVAFLQNGTSGSTGQQAAWKLDAPSVNEPATQSANKQATLAVSATTSSRSSSDTKPATPASTMVTSFTAASATSQGSAAKTQDPTPPPTSTTTKANEEGAEAEKGNSRWEVMGAIAGSVSAVVAIAALLISCFAPATVLKFVTCGRCGRRPNKEVRKQMRSAITKSMIRVGGLQRETA